MSMEEDMRQLQEIFARFDLDSDGSLTVLELAALLQSLGIKPNGDQLDMMLGRVDASGNGSIEFDELVEALLPSMNDEIISNQGQLLEVFKIFDRDGNGFISPGELAGTMAKMGHALSYEELEGLMNEADTDGDGLISFKEFANVMAKSAHDDDFLGFHICNQIAD